MLFNHSNNKDSKRKDQNQKEKLKNILAIIELQLREDNERRYTKTRKKIESDGYLPYAIFVTCDTFQFDKSAFSVYFL